MEKQEEKEEEQKDDLKKFCEVNFLRVHDRFDRIEQLISSKYAESKYAESKKPFYDNADIMRATGLAYRTLQEYRRRKLLIAVSDSGPNRYTPEEYRRFVYDVAPRGRQIRISRIDKECIDLDFEVGFFEDFKDE